MGKMADNVQLKDYRFIFGEPKTREEVIGQLQSEEQLWRTFCELTVSYQEEIIAFCMGNQGIKITYDSVFKYIFNPEAKPERLSDLLSEIIGEKVRVKQVLPGESREIFDGSSLVILDILVELESGAQADVEMQKVGNLFPGQRSACYSADMLIRQFSRVKARKKEAFRYKDVQKVYSIIFFENSGMTFRGHTEYLYHAKHIFDTGLEMDLLQEYFLIPLDIFRKTTHNEISKLEAWLYFLSSDKPEDILKVVGKYPEFRELYQDLIVFRYQPKELIDMYRKALREADASDIKYMVEEQQREIEELKETNESLQETNESLQETNESLQETNENLQIGRASCRERV